MLSLPAGALRRAWAAVWFSARIKGWRSLERGLCSLCLGLAPALSLSAGECICTTQTRSPDNKPAFVLLWPPPPPPLPLLNCSWMCLGKQLVTKEQRSNKGTEGGDRWLIRSMKVGKCYQRCIISFNKE